MNEDRDRAVITPGHGSLSNLSYHQLLMEKVQAREVHERSSLGSYRIVPVGRAPAHFLRDRGVKRLERTLFGFTRLHV